MNCEKLKPPEPRRPGRIALLGVATATVTLLGACSAQTSVGKNPAAVQLNPDSGPTSSTPTWSTATACATGFQGSAVFREVHRDKVSTNSISRATHSDTAPFGGTLQAPISAIQAAGGIPDGGTQKLVVICFSGPALTGTSHQEMDIFVTYSADGRTYTTRSTAPAGG
jgi:hypothetical protein